jgi:peptidoglycan/LPS O-acetylase OafA/YrhL
VISGYLITTLILKELNQTNRFSFKNFYERRARRILPALLFMMGISSVVGYYLLVPEMGFNVPLIMQKKIILFC